MTRAHAISLLLLVGSLSVPPAAAADDFDSLRLRWKTILTGGVNVDLTNSAVKSYLSSVQSSATSNQGSLQKTATRTVLWTDLASTSSSAEITTMYSRIRSMALAWATPGQSLYQNAALLADTISALDWMDANRYTTKSVEYDNWFDWEIGAPANLVDTAVLLFDQLTPDQLSRYMADVERYDGDPSIFVLNNSQGGSVNTGANLSDKCKIALLRGVLLKDPAKIALAVKDLSPVFPYVTKSDGFYLDGSFVFHNNHPYNGNYGNVLLGDVANLLYLMAGSPWDITDPNKANAKNWANDAYMTVLYKGAMPDMLRGRIISFTSSPDHAIGHAALANLLRLTQSLSAADSAPINSFIKRQLQDDTSRSFSTALTLDQIGQAQSLLNDATVAPAAAPNDSHAFASMDRFMHRRASWAAGITMHSTRIYDYESINNNNLKGWHTGDGMLYLYNADLTQFTDPFWPTIDWQRLPGTTVVAGSTPRQSQFGGSATVGGTSLDGYGAAMFQLNPDGRQLNAKKSWFLFDNEVVALGADIRSTAAGQTVETIVENRKLVTNGATFTADPAGAWANLAGTTVSPGIGYYFPDKTPFKTLQETRTGAWNDIDTGASTTLLSGTFRTVWFDHGAAPVGAKYSYVLLPGADAVSTAAYAANPGITIVQNDVDGQAATHSALGLRAVNFWTANKTISGITSDAVSSVIVHQAQGQLNISLADPTQTNTGTVHVTVNTAASSVLSQDPGVTVDQLAPAAKFSFSVKSAAGKTFRAALAIPPVVGAGGVVNGANFSKTLGPAAGSIGSLFGVNLSDATIVATTLPLPTTLGGVSVLVDGVAAPLYFVSAGQINFEFPWESAGKASVSIAVRIGNVTGAAQTVATPPASPGIFTVNSSGSGQGVVQIANTTTFVAPAGSILGALTRPAAAGEFLTIYCSGLGDVTNRPASGAAASGSPLSVALTAPTLTIGGVATPVAFAGLSPGFVGLFQVNAQVPAGTPSGPAIPLVLSVGGVASNTVTIAIQ